MKIEIKKYDELHPNTKRTLPEDAAGKRVLLGRRGNKVVGKAFTDYKYLDEKGRVRDLNLFVVNEFNDEFIQSCLDNLKYLKRHVNVRKY